MKDCGDDVRRVVLNRHKRMIAPIMLVTIEVSRQVILSTEGHPNRQLLLDDVVSLRRALDKEDTDEAILAIRRMEVAVLDAAENPMTDVLVSALDSVRRLVLLFNQTLDSLRPLEGFG